MSSAEAVELIELRLKTKHKDEIHELIMEHNREISKIKEEGSLMQADLNLKNKISEVELVNLREKII